MQSKDTESLLRECDAGSKMAVTSVDEILDKVQDEKLKQLLMQSKNHHEEIGNRIHSLLTQHGSDEKDPNPIAKGMSWMKTSMKMGVDECDATAAELIIDGCNMGIKSLSRYLNQYKAADETSKSICKELITIEDRLSSDLRCYL